MNADLPLSGWQRRGEFLDGHPELRRLLPNSSSFEWALRVHRTALSPYLRRLGREVLIHDAAASVLPALLLRPID